MNLHRALPTKESAIEVKLACKRHPQKGSKNNLDGLYEVLALSYVGHKVDQYTSVIREPVMLELTDRNNANAILRTSDDPKTKLKDYVDRCGSRLLANQLKQKSQPYKRTHQNSERDRNMMHRKRDNASGISSNMSNISRAKRVRIPKLLANLHSNA